MELPKYNPPKPPEKLALNSLPVSNVVLFWLRELRYRSCSSQQFLFRWESCNDFTFTDYMSMLLGMTGNGRFLMAESTDILFVAVQLCRLSGQVHVEGEFGLASCEAEHAADVHVQTVSEAHHLLQQVRSTVPHQLTRNLLSGSGKGLIICGPGRSVLDTDQSQIRAPSHRTRRCSQMLLTKIGTHCCQSECSHSIASNIKGFACKFACKPAYLVLCELGLIVPTNKDLDSRKNAQVDFSKASAPWREWFDVTCRIFHLQALSEGNLIVKPLLSGKAGASLPTTTSVASRCLKIDVGNFPKRNWCHLYHWRKFWRWLDFFCKCFF